MEARVPAGRSVKGMEPVSPRFGIPWSAAPSLRGGGPQTHRPKSQNRAPPGVPTVARRPGGAARVNG